MNNNATRDKEQKDKACYYCVNNKLVVDYKDISVLRRFVSSYMKSKNMN